MGYCFLVFALLLVLPDSGQARQRWVELNIGPFRVDTDADPTRARQVLANLEQLRWILGKMLENKDLSATWPVRILITSSAQPNASQFRLAHGEYIAAVRPDAEPSYVEVAKLLLESNTPRLPQDVDTGVPQLFYELTAHGSKVTWAKKPPGAGLAWARVRLFTTKPEYAGRFPVFLNNLKGGSLLTVAEANAFGKPSETLEKEAAAYLSSGAVEPVTTSERPLDPKRDVGEHSFDEAMASVFVADTILDSNRAAAESAYKAAGNAGMQALAQEGLAMLAIAEKNDPSEYLESAITAGSKNAWVFVTAAESQQSGDASSRLMKARELNPRWSVPAVRLAELTADPRQKETYLQEACQKNPRSAQLWQELAELQTKRGEGKLAQNSWIRAEDAAANPEEKQAIHQKRGSLENERLDAQENAKRQEAAAAKAEEDRLRNEQLSRIGKAEQKANQANADGSSESSGEVVQWFGAGEQPLQATLTQVDCVADQFRLRLKTSAGRNLSLLVPDPSKLQKEGPDTELTCGPLTSPKKLTLTYKTRPDKRMGTAGDVVRLRFE
jgi:hypothetical protein